jgi:4-alpha-glucanotransferase
MIKERASGILLHPTSLAGKYGIGSLGKAAYEFVDWLKEAGQRYWQILPLGPTGYGDSPYQCFSSKAGNPYLIDLDKLVENGWLEADDLPVSASLGTTKIDYGKVIESKLELLRKAEVNFRNNGSAEQKERYDQFVGLNGHWLEEYVLFMALKEKFNKKPWYEWDHDYRMHHDHALNQAREELKTQMDFHHFLQFEFFNQWMAVKEYANNNGIKIIGDIPIYVAMDSADTWGNTHLFQFDEQKNPIAVGGVPPDYFSKTGQLWGNPLFNWDVMAHDDFAWWRDRIHTSFILFDLVRIDHFRGFAGYWAVPYGEETAINGAWKDAPGKALFDSIRRHLGERAIIAEDLGVITPDVADLRDSNELPGMKILQFAFDSKEENDFIPHSYDKNCVVYTGTHDNDTTRGWFKEASADDKQYCLDYVKGSARSIHWDLIRCAWASIANTALAPMQDVLGLNTSARMNFPGHASGNWQWRMKEGVLTPELAEKLKGLTKTYGRLGS